MSIAKSLAQILLLESGAVLSLSKANLKEKREYIA